MLGVLFLIFLQNLEAPSPTRGDRLRLTSGCTYLEEHLTLWRRNKVRREPEPLCHMFCDWLCAQGDALQEGREPCVGSCDLAIVSSITRSRPLLPLGAVLL